MRGVYFRWKIFLIGILFISVYFIKFPVGYEYYQGILVIVGAILFWIPIYKLFKDWWHS